MERNKLQVMNIPVDRYMHNFFKLRYGYGIVIDNEIIFNSIFPERTSNISISYTPNPETHVLICIVPRKKISILNYIDIRKMLYAIFIEHFYTFIFAQRNAGLSDKEAIERFYVAYDICEDELKMESMQRKWRRFKNRKTAV